MEKREDVGSGDLHLREDGVGRGIEGKISNSDCGEFGREPSGDESLHGHDFGRSGRHLPRLAQLETESRLCQWPEIAKPSSSSPAQLTHVAHTHCPQLPTTNSALHTHSTLQALFALFAVLSQGSARQPGGIAASSQLSFLWFLFLSEMLPLTLSPHISHNRFLLILQVSF